MFALKLCLSHYNGRRAGSCRPPRLASPRRSRLGLEALEDRTLPSATPVANLVVFGDSLADVGNLHIASQGAYPPGNLYDQGRFSNGPLWVETLAEYLGKSVQPSLAGGLDYSFAGARVTGPSPYGVPDVTQQVGGYLQGHLNDLGPSDLFAFWAGPNDFFFTSRDAMGHPTSPVNPTVPADALAGDIATLITAKANGARQFLVANLPPLGLTPFFQDLLHAGAIDQNTVNQVNGWSAVFNAELAAKLQQLRTTYGVTIAQLDASQLILQAAQPGNPFGFTNWTNAVGPYNAQGFVTAINPGVDPAQYLFFDSVHPGARAEHLLGVAAAAAVKTARGDNTIVVTNTTDAIDPLDGGVSLREAVELANAMPGDQTITFDPALTRNGAATITLNAANGPLLLTDTTGKTTIAGPGANRLTVSGNDASRVFSIAGGATATITDLTIAHGHASGMLGLDFGLGYGGGAGILNQAGARLTLSRDTLRDNQAEGAVGFTVVGGGLLNLGTATVLSCRFVNNQATGGGTPADSIGGAAGGAIDNFGGPTGGATLTAADSVFTGNVARSAGGGFYFGVGGAFDSNAGLAGFFSFFPPDEARPSTATLTNCVFSDNLATGGPNASGQGGGVNNGGAGSVMTLVGCAISGNRALGGGGGDGTTTGDSEGQGGGLYNEGGGTANLIGCIVSNNLAQGGANTTISSADFGAGGAFGGGILNNFYGTVNIYSSIIVGNRAQGGAMTTQPGPGSIAVGGGISSTQHTTLTMTNCEVLANTAIGGHGGAGTNALLAAGQLAGFAFGGGIDVSNSDSIATIRGSVIAANQAIGGAGGAGNNGANGYGGGIGVGWGVLVGLVPDGSQLTLTNSFVLINTALGGAGGAGADGGTGLGGGLYVSGSCSATVTASLVALNQADGGAAGAGGHVGQGHGGGVAYQVGSVFNEDSRTEIRYNHASTSDDDIFLAP
jgi:phospholipase/lecithinase/hemolysin